MCTNFTDPRGRLPDDVETAKGINDVLRHIENLNIPFNPSCPPQRTPFEIRVYNFTIPVVRSEIRESGWRIDFSRWAGTEWVGKELGL